MTGAVETPRAAVNAVAEIYGRYIEWAEKMARGETPKDTAGSLALLLDLFSTDEELLARSVDLAQLMKTQPNSDLPPEILPESQFLADYVSALPDADRLRAEISDRSARIREIMAQPDPEKEQFSRELSEPFEAQWIGVREAAKLLFNQVQLFNANAWASAWETAAQRNGQSYETDTQRGDDGSMIRTVSVSFDRDGDAKPRRWWQRSKR